VCARESSKVRQVPPATGRMRHGLPRAAIAHTPRARRQRSVKLKATTIAQSIELNSVAKLQCTWQRQRQRQRQPKENGKLKIVNCIFPGKLKAVSEPDSPATRQDEV